MPGLDEFLAVIPAKQEIDATKAQREAAALSNIPAPEKPQVGMIATARDHALQGASFGFADEAEAGLKTLAKMASGQSADYDKEVAAVRERIKAGQQQNPGTALASGLAGGIATTFIPGLGAAKSGQILSSAAQAAKGAALHGFGGAEGGFSDRLSSAAISGALGGAIGGGIAAGAKGIQAIADKTGVGQQLAKALGGTSKQNEAMASAFKDKEGKVLKDGLTKAGEKLRKDGYIKAGKSIQETAAHLERDIAETGEKIGGFLAGIDKAAEQNFSGKAILNGEKIMRRLSDAIQKETKANPGSAIEIEKAALAPVKNFVREFIEPAVTEGKAPRLTLTQLQAFRTTIKDAYAKADASDAVTKALKTIERESADIIEDAVRTRAPKVGIPRTAIQDFLKMKHQFNFLSAAHEAAKRGVNQAENLAAGAMVHMGGMAVGAMLGGGLSGDVGGALKGAGIGLAGAAALGPTASRILPTIAAGREALSRIPGSHGVGPLGQAVQEGTLRELFRQGN